MLEIDLRPSGSKRLYVGRSITPRGHGLMQTPRGDRLRSTYAGGGLEGAKGSLGYPAIMIPMMEDRAQKR